MNQQPSIALTLREHWVSYRDEALVPADKADDVRRLSESAFYAGAVAMSLIYHYGTHDEVEKAVQEIGDFIKVLDGDEVPA